MEGLKVGELARRAGVNQQTILYYERRGLIPEPPRTPANYRVYPGDAVRRVRFIRQAQELGFTLQEVEELMSLRADPRTGCDAVRVRAQGKVSDIDQKLASLQAMRRALVRLIGECVGSGPTTDCPILDALDAESRP